MFTVLNSSKIYSARQYSHYRDKLHGYVLEIPLIRYFDEKVCLWTGLGES